MDNEQLLAQIASMMESQTKAIYDAIKESENRVNLKIENEVSKRIESLFDGYQLVHEKQWTLQRQVDELLKRVERLESLAG